MRKLYTDYDTRRTERLARVVTLTNMQPESDVHSLYLQGDAA